MVVHYTDCYFNVYLKFFIAKSFMIASKKETILINNLTETVPNYGS